MRLRVLLLSLATLFLLNGCSSATTPAEPPKDAAAPADAAPSKDVISGTWVINLSKSSYSPADLAPKSGTSTLQASADGIHVMTDGVDSKGRKTQTDYNAKFDGADVPTNGTVDGKPSPDIDSVSWKKIDDHNFETVQKLKGQALLTTRVVVAEDGKTRTNTVTGKNAQGQTINNTVVFDKQ
jgi:hypothetical protein